MSIQQQQGDEERRRREEEQDKVNAYADAMIHSDQERHYTGRATGAGRTYREVNIGTSDSPRIEHVETP